MVKSYRIFSFVALVVFLANAVDELDEREVTSMKTTLLQVQRYGQRVHQHSAKESLENRKIQLLEELDVLNAELGHLEQDDAILEESSREGLDGKKAVNLLEGTTGCHTITEADNTSKCYQAITWAKSDGIGEHPDWYPGLKPEDSINTWQKFIWKSSKGECPPPCNSDDKVSKLCKGVSDVKLWKPAPDQTTHIKILSYNLFWWNLFGLHNGTYRGQKDSAGHLVKDSNKPPYDVMGFQECQDREKLLGNVGLLENYELFQDNHAICMGYRNSTWDLIDHGLEEVAEDQPTEYYGTRGAQWMRLRHKSTNATLIFVNHHGPLSVNSGGMCGGESTAHNILQLIKDKGQEGDIIVLVGDFNSNAAGSTVQTLWKNLVFAYNGNSFGGVDNVFTNVPVKNTVSKRTLGSGGSDHKAISVTIKADGARKSKWYDRRRRYDSRRRWGPGPKPRPHSRDFSFNHGDKSTEPSKAVHDAYHSQCGIMESDMEYTFDHGPGWHSYYQTKDPRACCGACQKNGRCKSWSWSSWVEKVKSPSCTLMGNPPSGKKNKEGVMSGLPTAQAARAAAAAGKQALKEMN